jgi:molybdopterin-guanine dinucleotide biosynthesis protein A
MPSAAILTGGRAGRFQGRDKSALRVQGRTILEHLVEVLDPLSPDIMLVGRADVPEGLSSRVRAVEDRIPGRGPLGGLDTALAEAVHSPLILVACDMPFVTSTLLDRLTVLASGVDAAVPLTSRGLHPLCAVYNPVCRPTVAYQLAAGRLAMKELLSRLRIRMLEEADMRDLGDPDRLLANVNTPGEYASLAEPPGDHNK